MRLNSFLFVFAVLCSLAAGCYSPSRVDWARGRVAVGMPRDKAVPVLQAESWYHVACQRRSEGIEDLFFFGSQDYDEAEIVIVLSMLRDDTYTVESIGTFEPNAWHTAYNDCIDRQEFR
jgi:hypothetical protein